MTSMMGDYNRKKHISIEHRATPKDEFRCGSDSLNRYAFLVFYLLAGHNGSECMQVRRDDAAETKYVS